MTEKEVSDLLEKLRVESGLDVNKNNSRKLSQLRDLLPKGVIPEGMRIDKVNDFFRRRQNNPNATIKFIKTGSDQGNINRKISGKKQLDFDTQIAYTQKTRKHMVDELVGGYKIKPTVKMHGHHIRMLQMYAPFFDGLSDADALRLAKFAVETKFPLGDAKANIAILDEDFHKILHDFMREKGYQVGSGKVAEGTPDLGKTFKSRKNALQHFFKNVQEPIEAKLSEVRWDQQAKYNPLSQAEFENQLAWYNSDEYAEIRKQNKYKSSVTQVGGRLGGEPSYLRSNKLLSEGVEAAQSGGGLAKKLWKLSPFAIGTGLLISPGIVKAAEERYAENPSIANLVQLKLEQISHKANQASAAAIVPTVVPEPTTSAAGLATIAVAETVDTVASGGSLLIDAARWGINNPDGLKKFMPKLPMQTNEGIDRYSKNIEEDDKYGQYAMPF